jgi:RNA polymerase sigma factor for flagellar operon FliA
MSTAQLWLQYKNGASPDIKRQIILNYTNLVHYVIHNSKFISNKIFDDQDYFQFGIEGLSEAIDRFDPEYGTKFETYAIQRIRGKIIDELRKIQSKQKVYTTTDEELYHTTMSLNNSIDEDSNCQLYEVISDESETPIDTAEKNESKELLAEAIKKLDEKERLIITLYYYENMNYAEIAKVIGVTVSRVSQVHSKIIDSLKKKLAKLYA